MEYTGLVNKYKINRPLTDEERKLHLHPKVRLDIEPHYFFSTIKSNSTFIEAVDKYYGWKGFLTIVALAIITIFVGAYLLFLYIALTRGQGFPQGQWRSDVMFLIFSASVILPLVIICLWLLRKESFCYTHNPIRLNRKTRMVHVFRFNGTVLSASWDTLFFTLGRGNRAFGIQTWDVRGHLLDADGTTVRETFALAMAWENQNDVRRYWEYVRRYMEDGPQAIESLTPVCLPIASRRETWMFGLMRLALNIPGKTFFQIFLLPAFFLMSLGRWFAMHTSRIPVWPSEVDEVCRIEPNDSYERDDRANPPEMWKVM